MHLNLLFWIIITACGIVPSTIFGTCKIYCFRGKHEKLEINIIVTSSIFPLVHSLLCNVCKGWVTLKATVKTCTEKEFCYVFQRAINFLNKRLGWGYKLKNGLLKQTDTCQDHHEVLWWLQPDSFKSLYFRLLAAFTNKLKIGII